MKIVLVHPAGSNWMPGKKDVSAAANRMAPLGLLSIAAWLEQAGHEVYMLDCLGPGPRRGNAHHAETILRQRPNLVGFSATTSAFLDGYDLTARIKTERPDVKTVFGGVHVSAMGARLLEKFPHIDFLAMGEGEVTMAELAEGRDLASIDGLIWRNGEDIITNPPRAQIPDLDNLPFPAYEKLSGFPRDYNLPLFSFIQTPGATMTTSRGCLYRCSYCDRSVFKRSFRYNSAEYVYAHLKYLNRRFGVRHVNFYDDLFTMDRKRITRLCDLLVSKPLGMHFNCAVRVGHADDDLLRMLKEAGCLQVSVGIETGDADLAKQHKPGVSPASVRETIRRIQARGLRAKGLFMMGLPGETEASIQKTSDFVMSLDLDDMNMSKFTPFFGAPVWSSIHEAGTLDEDWKKMNCLNFVFIPKEIGSLEKLDLLYNTHVKRFYNDKRWRRKFMRRIWQHRWSLWRLIRDLPDFLSAMRSFEPQKST